MSPIDSLNGGGRSAALAAMRTAGGFTYPPSHYGLKAMSYPPGAQVGATALTSQTIHVVRLFVEEPFTCSAILTAVSTAGSGFTSSGVALFNADCSSKLGESGSLNSVWNSSTEAVKESSITPVAITIGEYCVALFAHASSPPSMYRSQTGGGNIATFSNYGRSGQTLRFATGGTGQTSIPATLTLTSSTTSWWAALK